MLKFFLGLLIEKVLEIIREVISDYFKLQQKKKEDAKVVKDAIAIKDPTARANAIANILR
jgi:hypothetical protein